MTVIERGAIDPNNHTQLITVRSDTRSHSVWAPADVSDDKVIEYARHRGWLTPSSALAEEVIQNMRRAAQS